MALLPPAPVALLPPGPVALVLLVPLALAPPGPLTLVVPAESLARADLDAAAETALADFASPPRREPGPPADDPPF
jgi:hypothetical protein